MSSRSEASFASQVSAVSPLKGDAIDGSRRVKAKGRRKLLPDYDVDARRTFACPNRNCDHAEWTHERQLQHLGLELRRVLREFARVDPENPVVVLHAGGVVLSELTRDEILEGTAQYGWYRKRGIEAPVRLWLVNGEYQRRRHAGTLPPMSREEVLSRRRERALARSAAPWATADELRAASAKARNLRSGGQPVPDEIRRLVREYQQRKRLGLLGNLGPDVIASRRAEREAAARAQREAALPPVGERRLRRIALGLSAKELGELIGVSDSPVRSWERGGRLPSSPVIRDAYARLLASADLAEADPSAKRVSAKASAARAAAESALPPLAERRLRRIALGLSTYELAAKLGVNGTSVDNWEKGRYAPGSTATLEAYVQLLASADPAEAESSTRAAHAALRRSAWPPARVIALRTALGLNVTQFAARLGVGRSSVQNWESGRSGLAPSTVAKLDALAEEAG